MATPFRKGTAVLEKKSGGGQFISIAADESITVAPIVGLDEMISADMHEFWEVNPFVSTPCFGTDCPACSAGNNPKFKAFLPVVTQEGEVKIFSFGISVARQIEEIDAETGGVQFQVLKIKRTGTGLRTRYSVVPLGKKVKAREYDMPDIIKALGPSEPELAAQVLIDRGLLDEMPKALAKKVKPKAEADKPARARKSKPVETPPEDEDDDTDTSDSDEDGDEPW